MPKETTVYMHFTIDKEVLQLLRQTIKCLEKTNQLLKLNGDRLLKSLKGSLKVVK